MRYTLRSLFCRWKVRLAYLLAGDPLARRFREPARPRLVFLENRTAPAGLSSLLASFSAGGPGTFVRVADPVNPNSTSVGVGGVPASAALSFTATSVSGVAQVNSKVFADANRNGVLDAGEAGVGNARVQLFDASGTLLGTATSDANGNFSFSSAAGRSTTSSIFNTALRTGSLYQLRGQSNAAPAIGLWIDMPSGVAAARETSIVSSSTAGASIGGLVFTDTNGNGRFDLGEPGVGNVTVNLFDSTNTFVNSATTAVDGSYNFTLLVADTYTVVFDSTTLPVGNVFTTQFAPGSTPNDDSDADTTTGASNPITVTATDVVTNVFAGVYVPVIIGDFVFADTNGNGIQDGGEGGQAGVTVNLLDGTGTVVSSQTTAANGLYLFSVAPGTYQVEVIAPAGFNFSPAGAGANPALDSDVDPITGRTALAAFNSGDFDLDVDAGITSAGPATGSIGDFVWFDANANGIQDVGEFGLPNMIINLYDGAGTFITSTTPNGLGQYSFTGLAAGNYIVEFAPTAAFFVLTAQGQGPDPRFDSDANPITGRTSVITLGAGENNSDIDAGLLKPTSAMIGDFVWLDTNGNGVQDAGEAGVANVTVNLLTGAGVFVATTTTDASGQYLFLDVTPGNYQVEFIAPAGFNFTTPDQGGNDATDSDADLITGRTVTFSVAANQSDRTRDAGLVSTPPVLGGIGDFVWFDQNNNGIQDPTEFGVPNQVVNLLDGTGALLATTITDSLGRYLFANLAAGNYIVEFVTSPAGWSFTLPNQGPDPRFDSDVTSFVGGVGRTSVFALAPGVTDLDVDAGLTKPTTVLLGDFVWNDLNCNGIQDPGEPGVGGVVVNALDSTGTVVATTTTDANGKYLINGLTPGSYSVRFTLPIGFVFTMPNQGSNDQIDSDADIVTGQTQVVTLAAGQADMTLDAGLCAVAAIGDFVWNDFNMNGIQDPGEPGIAGVTVNLLDAGGAVVGTQLTDANGLYLFTNLRPETYSVRFTLPSGFVFSPPNQGSNDQIDSDANPITGVTGQYMLSPGETNRTVDAGMYQPMTPVPSSIRGKVYLDLNNDGIPQPNEPGIAGAKLTLTGTEIGGGTVNREVYSGPDGTYVFTGLRQGIYKITQTQPPNYQDGKDRAGSEGGVVTNDMISDIPIPAGVDAFNYDFGERLTGNGGKASLLASSGTTPTLAGQASAMPSSPTFGNAVAATRLADPAFQRFVVTAGDTGTAPVVRVFDFGSGTTRFAFNAYSSAFRGGVRVAVGDVTGDGTPDIVTAPGAGGGPHIRVFDGNTGGLVAEFFAYSASFTGGVYVAVGDVNNDGVSEIITGAGEGGGAHVRVFSTSGDLLREFFAYDGGFAGGVRVASGDVNGDGLDDIITAAGPGGGPHVKVYSGNAAQGLLSEAFVYDASFIGGVYAAAGDTNGDGRAEVVVGGGAGTTQRVRVLNGLTYAELYSFVAYGSTFTGGTRVGSLDIDGDGRAEVLTSPGAGLPAFTRIVDVNRGADAENFMANDPAALNGMFVTGGR